MVASLEPMKIKTQIYRHPEHAPLRQIDSNWIPPTGLVLTWKPSDITWEKVPRRKVDFAHRG